MGVGVGVGVEADSIDLYATAAVQDEIRNST